MIIKLETYAEDKNTQAIVMVSDFADDPIQKATNDLLLSLKSNNENIENKYYNYNDKAPFKSTYNIKYNDSHSIKRVNDIIYNAEVEPLLFIADFINFELLRHFRKKMKKVTGFKFHSESALDGFKLKKRIAFIDNKYIGDILHDPNQE